MAGKQAVVVVLDIGKTMESKINESGTSRFDIARKAVQLLVKDNLFGLVLVGTEETDNALNEAQGGYENVYVAKDLEQLDKQIVSDLESFGPTAEQGDIIDGLVVAVDMIQKKCGKKKYIKRIFIVSDGASEIHDSEQLPEIIDRINVAEIKLNLITISMQEEGKNQNNKLSKTQQANFVFFNQLIEGTEGGLYSSEFAMQIYKRFKKRLIHPVAKFKSFIEFGTQLNLPVEIYSKVKEEKLPSLGKYSTLVEFSEEVTSGKVGMNRFHAKRDDPSREQLDEDEITKAYYYGKKLVPVSETDLKSMQFQSSKSFLFLGFLDKKHIKHDLFMSGVDIVLAQSNNESSKKAFNAMVMACFEKDVYIIGRFTWRDNQAPKLVCLIPYIHSKYMCFYMNQLPTCEDIRDFPFRPLKESTKMQQDAIDKMIDAMDLDQEDPEEGELLQVKATFNPVLQYFYQCIEYKGMNNEGIPEFDPNILKYLNPDEKLVKKINTQELQEVFPLQVNELAKKKATFWAEIKEEPQEMLVEKEFEPAPVFNTNIRIDNAIEDFNQLLNDRTTDRVSDAVQQFGDLIIQRITGSFLQNFYPQALE